MPSIPMTAELSSTRAEGESLLAVEHLEVTFATPEGMVRAVDDASFELHPGATLGIVGESGSGKSQLFLALMGLLASNGHASGRVRFGGTELLDLSPQALNAVRGARMAMVFQDPMTSLNPYLTIGTQLAEVLTTHKGMSRADARKAAVAMMERMRIPEARQRLAMYPHEFSGGMRQRVMIAMALLCEPALLIADEPTTALDVTIQAEILALIAELRRTTGTAVVLITHDLGVIAGLVDRIMVMYGGRIVEAGPTDVLFRDPQHPYTEGLLLSSPRLDEARMAELATIPGQPPNPLHPPSGCVFRDRCPHVMPRCSDEVPFLRAAGSDRLKACHLERL